MKQSNNNKHVQRHQKARFFSFSIFHFPFSIAFIVLLFTQAATARPAGTSAYFERVRDNPVLLRTFLAELPKGGDLHNHLDGAVYAENFLRWAAEDKKCVNLDTHSITLPPCNTDQRRPPVSEILYNDQIVNPLIDAFSTRNFERRPVSGHNQFFATFLRFMAATFGREGSMIAETTARAAKQNVLYLELMQSYGMNAARELAQTSGQFSLSTPVDQLARLPAMNKVLQEAVQTTDRAEQQWRRLQGCDSDSPAPGCGVKVRYLAQVIRTFPPEQVLAQTLLAFMLIEKDPRYVGLNFVAPEDHPITLRDHTWQMQLIGTLARHFPAAAGGITLHAGELAMGLVPPEALGVHIREAVEIAGARRIGHGVDIGYDEAPLALMQQLAKQGILVEINLTSNANILGIQGQQHPFETYRAQGVPLALSTDDEGVSRIDLTHEYQRAVNTYSLTYADLKELSRNALAYSFLPGENLFQDRRRQTFSTPCAKASPARELTDKACAAFLNNNEKAGLQWELEKRFARFEARYR